MLGTGIPPARKQSVFTLVIKVDSAEKEVNAPIMSPLLHEIRRNPLLWLVVFVPITLVGTDEPEAHTILFVASVLAIIPLGVLLSHATE